MYTVILTCRRLLDGQAGTSPAGYQFTGSAVYRSKGTIQALEWIYFNFTYFQLAFH